MIYFDYNGERLQKCQTVQKFHTQNSSRCSCSIRNMPCGVRADSMTCKQKKLH